MAYKGHRYVEEERRRRWPPAAATHRMTMGWADLRRRAASLACLPRPRRRQVVAVSGIADTPSSSFLARLAARPSAAMWVFR